MAGPDVSRDGSLASEESDRWSRDDEQPTHTGGSVGSAWRIRLRSWVITVPQLAALAALLLGAWNLLGSVVTGNAVFTQYRVVGAIVTAQDPMMVIHLGDIVLMAGAAGVLWLLTR